MANQSFVRTKMLGEKKPPASQVGIISWVRANLFSSIPNVIMSLLAFWAIYTVLSYILPWVFMSSWSAESLKGCRASIIKEYANADNLTPTGACWAVIRERWPQLLFGFYPKELYWRPVLAMVLLLVALSPILFSTVSRKVLYFSVAYPFFGGFWLLWGGTIWVPLAGIAGFVIAYLAIALLPKWVGSLTATILAGVLPLIWWTVLAGPTIGMLNSVSAGLLHDRYISSFEQSVESIETEMAAEEDELKVESLNRKLKTATKRLNTANSMGEREDNIAALEIEADELRGFLSSSVKGVKDLADVDDGVSDADIAALKEALSVENKLLTAQQQLAAVHKEVGRIGPQSISSDQMGGFLLSITLGVSGIALSLPIGILLALGRQSSLFVVKTVCVTFIEFIRGVPLITLLFVASVLMSYFLPPGNNFDLVLRVLIMVTLFSAAYMAEVVRGGLAALPTGQYEAADSLGLNYWKSTRLIILPQALKISIPNIVSSFIGLFKDTTLVSIVGLLDPIGLSGNILADQNWNGIIWELFAFIAVMFWIFTFSMSRYSMYLERKLQVGH
ncbi:MAG: amino acid ABC transporter permease [Paracoccaceae bacterium]